MSVSLILAQERTVVTNYYRVTNTITSSSGISREVFVKKTSTEEFDRVAVAQDMQTVTTTPTPSSGYYRVSNFYKDFTDVASAKEFSDSIKQRIQSLLNNYNKLVSDFQGSDSTTYQSI